MKESLHICHDDNLMKSLLDICLTDLCVMDRNSDLSKCDKFA